MTCSLRSDRPVLQPGQRCACLWTLSLSSALSKAVLCPQHTPRRQPAVPPEGLHAAQPPPQYVHRYISRREAAFRRRLRPQAAPTLIGTCCGVVCMVCVSSNFSIDHCKCTHAHTRTHALREYVPPGKARALYYSRVLGRVVTVHGFVRFFFSLPLLSLSNCR